MKNNPIYFYISLAFFALGIVLLQSANNTKSTVTDTYYAYVPTNLDFCNEKVPITEVDVYERMDRELIININYHTSTTLILKRLHKYFPIIEPILRKNNIPNDFKYVCVIESGLTNATSPAGAKGFWQFMTNTAKEFGLEINDEVDERYHLEKATQAACDYFNQAYKKFNNWTLVAASYNRGMGGVSKQLNLQEVDNFYDLYLTEETSRYVFRILALKEIIENPKKYNFDIPEELLYNAQPTKDILVDYPIDNLYTWAKTQGINYKTLKYYNPWLISTSLSANNNKTYTLKLPK